MNEIQQQLEDLRGQWKGELDPEKKKKIEEQAESLKCRHVLDGKKCNNARRSWDSFSCESCFNRLKRGERRGKLTIEQVREIWKNRKSTLV